MAAEEAKIKLYWLNESRAQRIVWLLEELKIDHDVELFRRNPATMLAPPELEAVHPLGKSPVISVTTPGGEPIILAESGFITSYLCDHFPEGKRLVPTRWKDGMEGKIGGETEAWLRYEHILQYAEGSLMPHLLMSLVFNKMKSGSPFYVRPIVNMIADRVLGLLVFPNVQRHLKFLEQQLSTSGGDYLCGATLTAADILISFPLMAGEKRFDTIGNWEGGSWKATHPKVVAYVEKLKQEEGFKKSLEKIKEIEGGGSKL